ncbi:cell division protein FtsZ [Hyphomicrobium methylovorum]|uniref:cell division protein FtsZ n=1 Tax=Hyphomicrobium methylovorum TaxID=84 RepID=UPI0015E73381|nr:cell division protein FtsZ [Hyphomicrobium methylovorum]MBA2126566.1 cell division protein FtsZ [Hyphomicrobium methylovorum]
MSIKLQLPTLVDVKPRLTVVGVGGAGCNAVNNMIAAGLQGVEFVVANTDAQSLAASSAEYRVQLGANLTEGLGAGSRPEIGEAAAEEAIDELRTHIAGSHMVFVAAGMGGGTGTGAATVVARAARETGALTVGVVCKPFQFEGARRMRIAEAGVQTLRQYVDTLIVIPNQNLFRIANERTTFAEAFVLADQVLYSGVACIVELVLKEGLINLDFADVRTIMSGMGTAMMGTGEATGERRAVLAAEEAIANPLLDDVTLRGARGLLLSISGGRDMTLYEVDEAASRVREEVDPEANIIVGATFDDQLGDRLRVSIVASGMNRAEAQFAAQQSAQAQAQARGGAKQPAQQPMQSGNGGYGAPEPFSQPQAPAKPQGQAGKGNPPGDLQRRLSEAMQPQSADRSQNYSNETENDSRGSGRDSWIAPGNVSIEDGLENFPPLTGNALLRTPPLPPGGLTTASGHHFEPQAPAEFQRGGRRLPQIEDFPPQAQKEWNARRSTDGGRSEESRKSGFFGRLTNFSRSVKQSSQRDDAYRVEGDDENPSLPVFVARERR